jgi:hypothetical protein
MPHRRQAMELYDLSIDPSEKNNVVADHPETVRLLTEKLTKIVKNGRTTDGAAQPNDIEWWDDLTWISP